MREEMTDKSLTHYSCGGKKLYQHFKHGKIIALKL